MAGETIKCPHCECKVKIADVDKEDGNCPECGQYISPFQEEDPYQEGFLDDDEGLEEEGAEYEGDDEDDNDLFDSDDGIEPDFDDELFDPSFEPESKPKRSRVGMSMGNPGAGGGSSRKKSSSSSSSGGTRKSNSPASRSSRGSRKK